ncbi:hypothetical protein DPMN_004250 [Dreissena polymorpha]|uniref:Uncharacterized protein n=1 Tax=Dreissena polymorpha TaxID=45954 RepID=A0A9D4RVR4_DREPO|nr:hypothetical protein DPMN_004250 [Dreissena polymorpha]
MKIGQYIVASRVLTRKNAPPLFHDDWKINRPCFFTDPNHFRTQPSYQETHVLTKFHEHLTKNVTFRGFTCFHSIHIEKTAPPPGGHVFSPIWTIFELVRDINETSVLTKFHDDWANIVTSRVFTRHTAHAPWRPYWASNVTSPVFTSFELSRGINGTNVLTKFHEDQTINVASRVFTRQNVDDVQRITKAHHEHVVLR